MYLADSSWVFFCWWSLSPFDIVDIPSKFVCCKIWPWHFQRTKAISHLKSASLGIFLFVFYGKLTLKFLWDPWNSGATWWSPKMWLSCKFWGKFRWADFGNGTLESPFNRGLVSVEGGSSTSILGQDHLQRATLAQVHGPGQSPRNANYGRNPFRWLVGKGVPVGVCCSSVCWSNLRTHVQKKM